MRSKLTSKQSGYALLVSLIILALSAGIIIFEFQAQKQQNKIDRELCQKFIDQSSQNLKFANKQAKGKVHKIENKSGKLSE